ncbi:TetR/AcrR family transcriptional regulator [Sinomicrobium weinanense]|uniref:TetR/AcrR family transcriptional regulator n=1 Tax=Sinomicrobium weinanense TaxID=2842200 RepID=A0A926JP68_9FLAO|nr:TetR/AcrR family transcriptional regulator [Sinomicrobium weinanense]MBC9794691.1 TetR/AcrR family transcriptional regulator [Sinomicrobium weinanense]MBU3124176.1 TetR/AcrR family transcriptional regulator [Sinomicrobium weinanense]
MHEAGTKIGFEATSIDRILNTAQLSKGAFYHHFKNKKELGLAVISKKIQKRIYDGMIKPLTEKYENETVDLLKGVFVKRINRTSGIF